MIFVETRLKDSYMIDLAPIEDGRGSFARSFCRREFEQHGLDIDISQCNLSYNRKKGTLRGMHYQTEPYAELKVVSCIAGAIYDVIIDLRLESPTYREWLGVELNADNRRMLYVPKGFAHGFQTLQDETVVYYQMGEFYNWESAAGVRWNDPAFAIEWPDADDRIISEKDNSFALWKDVSSYEG